MEEKESKIIKIVEEKESKMCKVLSHFKLADMLAIPF